MFSFRKAAPLALVVGVVAFVAFAAYGTSASPAETPYDAAAQLDPPVAHASGGDAGPLIYPSIVNVRLVRAQSALDRAAGGSIRVSPASAVIHLNAARSNMSQAWLAAKYVIETAPPPVATSPGSATMALPTSTGASSTHCR